MSELAAAPASGALPTGVDAATATGGLAPELTYVALLFVLFVLPRVLLRFKIPAAVTSVVLGVVAGAGFGLFGHDETLRLLATLGIVALFLFAGLDVDVDELHRGRTTLTWHLLVGGAALAGVTLAGVLAFGLDSRLAVLVALALLTPSTGFILDSLATLDVEAGEEFWIKTKAVASELLALLVLFVVLQSTTWHRFTLASVALLVLVLVLPVAFKLFAEHVVPHAPKSEFAFLLMLAVVAAYATRRLGVYYLVGAFIVGLVARRYRDRLSAVGSEQMLHSIEVFASFFVPFYFFKAGLGLQRADLTLAGLGLGLALVLVAVPVRIVLVALQWRVQHRAPWSHGLRLGGALGPTLVFTLVIAEILHDRLDAGGPLYTGLVFYALLSTLIPSLVLRIPVPEFEHPHLAERRHRDRRTQTDRRG